MSRFVFSADAHVNEPPRLFLDGLPEHLKSGALHATRDETFRDIRQGERILHRLRINTGGGHKRGGGNDIAARLVDMEADGIDAELIFPQLALFAYCIEDPELELESLKLYNDWVIDHFKDHLDKFVPAAVLPVRDFANTLAEFQRIVDKGYRAAMLPCVTPEGVPHYNSKEWDPIFAFAAEQEIPFCLHTGTGVADVVADRGPGAAVYNYTLQMGQALDTVTRLVAGGVLDRNPKAQVLFIECGASWLAGAAERMDEVYDAHHMFVSPKLSRKPSEVIRDQVKCSFQYDRACLMSRSVTGHEAMLWASDYPHQEGTFPNSQEVLAQLFEGTGVSEQERKDIIGGTAARLFKFKRATI
ncbi:Amidohydrolase [compost metagenome]